jgi:hypothetical protein
MSSSSKRVAVAIAAGALPLSLTAVANPAAAIPPHAEEIAPLLAVFPDFDNRVVGYLNITREGFCDWEAGGAIGEPPLLKPASPGWERTTGTGEVGGVARDELHLELWPMDAAPGGESSCEDTSDATEPFATGTADVRATDRSLYGTDDGHGAYVADMGIRAILTASDGGRYRYHLHVIQVEDGRGTVRLQDSDHMRLIRLR